MLRIQSLVADKTKCLLAALFVLLPVGNRGFSMSSAASLPELQEIMVSELCTKPIVFLGEASHGVGATFELKANLIVELVDRCGFNLILFETGIYDYLHLRTEDAAQRKAQWNSEHERIFSGLLRAAPMWSWTREFNDLQVFLVEKMKIGKLSAGGIDDQINGNTWAIERLASHLSSFGLEESCKLPVNEFVSLGGYWEPKSPFSEARSNLLSRCFESLSRRIRESTGEERSSELAMSESLRRLSIRDLSAPGAAVFNGRDHSMFQNLLWWRNSFPAETKVIVWAHNVHIAAKGLGNEEKPFGAWAKEFFGNDLLSVGMTAARGTFQSPGPEGDLHSLPRAAKGSLEWHAQLRGFEGNPPVRYLDGDSLGNLGSVPGRLNNHIPENRIWGDFFDVVAVLQEERIPTKLPKLGD